MKQNTKINTKKTKKNTKIKKNTRLRKRTYKKVKNMRKNKKGGDRGVKRPREEDFGYDHGYDDFLNKIDFKNENDGQCRITRSSGSIVKTVSLGKTNQSGFTSKIELADKDELKNFVTRDINDGPQIVSIPVPPFRHAFLVNVLPDKIMISDWKGNEKLIGRQPRGGADYENYYDFMESLKDKYPELRIKFYIVNESLKEKAVIKNAMSDGGGCAEYIYMWVEGILLNDKNTNTNFFSI